MRNEERGALVPSSSFRLWASLRRERSLISTKTDSCKRNAASLCIPSCVKLSHLASASSKVFPWTNVAPDVGGAADADVDADVEAGTVDGAAAGPLPPAFDEGRPNASEAADELVLNAPPEVEDASPRTPASDGTKKRFQKPYLPDITAAFNR